MRRLGLIALLCAVALAANAETLNLASLPAYARPGFSLDWTFAEPLAGDEAWLRLPPSPAPNRPLTLRGLGLAEAEGLAGLGLQAASAARGTFVIPFQASEALRASSTGVGLLVGTIGQNWQLYLNGRLIRDESYLGGDGRVRVERFRRGVLVGLDPGSLRQGQNLLCIMVAGDPNASVSGVGGELLIGDYASLDARRSEVLRLVLIGIYAFFGLYHAMLFVFRPEARAYLFYALVSLLLALFLLGQTITAYGFFTDTSLVREAGNLAFLLLGPAFMAFIDTALGHRVSLASKAFAGLAAAAMALRLVLGGDLILSLWRYALAVPVAYALGRGALAPLFSRGDSPRSGRVALGVALALAVAGAALALEFVAPSAGRGASYADYAFLALAFGTAATLAGQFVRAYNEGEALGADLARRVELRSRELGTALSEAEALSARLSETRTGLAARADAAAADLRVATRVQRGFFPSSAPSNERWDTAFTYLPASGISGDFYDFYTRGDRLDGLVVGDVSGHGIASGLVTVLARSIFYRNFYELKGRSLGSMLEAINAELITELAAVDNFITAALLRLDASGGVEYASAAHTELLYRASGRLKAVRLRPKGPKDHKGPPLGREGLEAPYSSIRFSLKPGDVILAYTDGFDEAKNVDGQAFGVEGMLGALSAAPEGDADQMLDFIVREWRFHVSGTMVADDATALLLKRR